MSMIPYASAIRSIIYVMLCTRLYVSLGAYQKYPKVLEKD